MPRPKGLPKTGGRKAGTPTKVTAEVRSLAREYGSDAIKTLASIMASADSPSAARVAAAGMLLDRGYGKAAQPIDGDGEGGPVQMRVQVEFVSPSRD